MTRIYRRLHPGSLIGVIAPASGASEEALANAPAVLERLGYRGKLFPGCHQRCGYLAGDDTTRLDDLHATFADPEIAAILCLRGGYGSARLLPRIDSALIARHPKPLIGYSDITALHCLFAHLDLPSFHGPMLSSDLATAVDPLTEASLACLADGLSAGTRLAPPLGTAMCHQGGKAHGRLLGGNLSVLASLVGTPWALDTRGAILFLEEIGEAPYRVDRLLLQLQLAGALDSVQGVLLGSFSEADSPADVLREYLEPLGKPLLSGWPAGHGSPNCLLPLGVMVELDADAGHLTLHEDVIG